MGNGDLTGLKEISLPDPVVYVPQTPFWYVLFGLLFLIMIYLLFRWIRKRKKNRYRRLALARLEEIRSDWSSGGEVSGLRVIPELVKWTALQGFSRPDVARLSGGEWLEFLDGTQRGKKFSRGPGRNLPRFAYDTGRSLDEIPARDIKRMTALIRRWIRRHRV